MENNKRPESMESISAKSLADVSIAEWRDNFYNNKEYISGLPEYIKKVD